MSTRERTGVRDLAYSSWHRADNLRRLIGLREAHSCAVIDIDWCEYCNTCKHPLALIETQRSRSVPKAANVTRCLANLAGLRAYSVSFWMDGDGPMTFRVQLIAPEFGPVVDLSEAEYAELLLNLRTMHDCQSVRHMRIEVAS